MADEYAQQFAKACDGSTDAASELLLNNVCPRCVVRFMGASNRELYAEAPPDVLALFNALQAETGVKPEPSPQLRFEEGAVCFTCLGILQLRNPTVDVSTSTAADAARSQDDHEWCAVPQIGSADVAQYLREQGHISNDFAMEIMVPPAVALHEVSCWHWLKASHPEAKCIQGRSFPSCIVDIKDAVRLSLGTAVASEMQWQTCQASQLRLALRFQHKGSAGEVASVLQPRPKQGGRKRKWEDEGNEEEEGSLASLKATYEAALKIPASQFLERLPFPAPCVPAAAEMQASVWRQPLLLAGRYLKLLRGMPQSPWICGDDERVGHSSVQESIESVILPAFRADSCKMIAAGREDMDVRMLGSGRPFVLEVHNARAGMLSAEELHGLQLKLDAANVGAKVVQLQEGTKQMLAALKEGEEHKRKTYEAVCWAERPITEADMQTLSSVSELTVQQGTPVRVLHRRAALVRPRVIHSMQCRLVEGQPHYFVLTITTQAGTYIKEFVHGDFGRTHPNVGTLLGCKVDIVQLDVVEVDMQFP